MAWNGTHTFAAGAVLTAAQLNTYGSENLAALAPARSLITTTGTVTALAIPSAITHGLITANNASLLTIQGIAAGFDGQILTIRAKNAQVDFEDQSASAVAANRIANGVAGVRSLSNGKMVLVYDGGDARWVVVSHYQGAWITATFSAGHYTGSGSMTWTVGSGGALTRAYCLTDNSLTVSWYLNTTSVGGTLSTALQLSNALYGGHVVSKYQLESMTYNDNNAGNVQGFALATAGDTKIQLFKNSGGNWSNSTSLTNVFGRITFEV